MIEAPRRWSEEDGRSEKARQLFLRETEGIFAGRRGFVIGNGPSLDISSLERLSDDVTLGANLLGLAYRATEFRPTYLSITDALVWERYKDLMLHDGECMLLDSGFDALPGVEQYFFYRYRRLSPGYRKNYSFGVPFSIDLGKGYFGGYSVTYFNLQMAFHLGLNPIFLVGMDHRFTSNSAWLPGLPPKKVFENRDHFTPDYRHPGQAVNRAPVRQITTYFAHARKVFEATGVSVINLTPSSGLRVFPFASFSEVV